MGVGGMGRSQLEGLHLQKPLHHVTDAVLLRWFGVVAQQLTPPEQVGSGSQRHQQFHAATTGEVAMAMGRPLNRARVVACRGGDGIGEYGDRTVVFGCADPSVGQPSAAAER